MMIFKYDNINIFDLNYFLLHTNQFFIDRCNMFSFSSFHYVFFAVYFRFQNYDIALWGKNAKEETKS